MLKEYILMVENELLWISSNYSRSEVARMNNCRKTVIHASREISIMTNIDKLMYREERMMRDKVRRRILVYLLYYVWITENLNGNENYPPKWRLPEFFQGASNEEWKAAYVEANRAYQEWLNNQSMHSVN